MKKIFKIVSPAIAFLLILYSLFIWETGKAFEDIGESLNVPAELIKILSLENDEYALYYSSGAAFTSREWWVKKNGRLIYHISSYDGQVEDLKIKNGKPYLIGLGVNVDLSKENFK